MKKFLLGFCISIMLMLGMTVAASADVPAGSTLPAPASLTQTSATATSISMKWSAVSKASLYQVEIAEAGASYRYAGQTSATSCKITGLTAGKRYYVRVFGGYSQDLEGYYKYNYKCVTLPSTAKVLSSAAYPTSSQYRFNMKYQNSLAGFRVKSYNYKTRKTTTQYFTSTNITLKAYQSSAYKVVITPYTLINNKKCYASKSTVRYMLQQPQPKVKSHTNSSATLTWTKMVGATSYSIYVRKPGSSKFVKVKTTGNNSYKYSGMSAYQNYDLYIVANKSVSGKVWKSGIYNYLRLRIY